ncbi:serine hydrolase domain-containing protein [Sedimentitalea todarodis]|uniref:Serine hydrolase domain-containing protein n=1 Tax=Sedimentitalea todarodis TaxID=1631240 RepID=A0ABU3VHY4_9RHOB|nr:serine hydrolase domain-containing protein [Sedimentitalea todarodis]MDU9005792.1 serine hydrolase domain-containing protein [Sedimentitalea todarodis]
MSILQNVLDEATSAQDVPFAVAMTANSAGVTFSGAAGEAREGLKAAEDTAFRIFSMTKAIGSLAAMILIDRGKLGLDTPVADILPVWNDLRVLEGFDGDTPILRVPKTQATLRHLATHTSGMEYEFWNPDVPKYMEMTGHPTVLSGLKTSLMYPLTTDPGTRWGYGPSIDWLGQVVEAVDGRRIDAFCQDEILDPLGMKDTAFEPDALLDRLSAVSMRGEDGQFGPVDLAPPANPEFYGMGHALYSTAPDYLRILRMVLNRGKLDGTRILSDAAFDAMIADQMNGLTFQSMHSVAPTVSADVEMPAGTTHSFAFVRNETDIPGMRSAGALSWAGVCNTHYWIDPSKDLAAVIMTQSLPFLEPRFQKTYQAYEQAVYAGL